MDASPTNLITACREIRTEHNLSQRHSFALAWIIGKLLRQEKEDGKDERTINQDR
jgi:hypothetical protein